MTDKEYTDAVDGGTYTAFSSDSAGYGLAQWTYSTYDKYAGTNSSASSGTTSSAATVTEQMTTDPAKSFNKSLAGTYKTTANLYIK